MTDMPVVLEDGDYIAPEGGWFTVKGALVWVVPIDTGLRIVVYKDGKRDEDPIAELFVPWSRVK